MYSPSMQVLYKRVHLVIKGKENQERHENLDH